jgi:hypothetical protein
VSAAAVGLPKRALALGVLGIALAVGLFVAGVVGLRLAAGIVLLAAAGGLFHELVRADGWASGGATTYGVALVSLVIELTLPFISWYDLWLTTLCGFGATLSAVTVACMPYLDRKKVPDMMDEVDSDDASLAIPALDLSPRSQQHLLIFSQLVMLGNFLVVWATIHRHLA